MKHNFFLVFLYLAFPCYLIANPTVHDSIPPRTYTAMRTENPPRIDGILDDPCWNEGIWHGGFIQQQPYEGQPGSSPTEIKILYNTNYLFVAIRCYDREPEKIRSIFSGRDQFAGDMTGIALDSYDDNKTAFEFNLSAAGQKVDLKHKGDFEFDLNWNAVWDGRVGREDSAWIAEMRIPFSQLRYSDKEEQRWGMHIWRWIDRKSEESQWTLIPINSPAMVYLFGELNGIRDIRSSRQVELLPYGSVKYSPKLGDNINPYGKTRELFPNGGFDAKIGIRSNFTLDATINPDFSQVEADPSILNLTAFETVYDEKRPFFLESREIFDYTINSDKIYYSRRIGQAPGFVPSIDGENYIETPENSTILGATKLTGKTAGGLSVGIIESLTSAEYSQVYRPGRKVIDTLSAPLTNYFVMRLMQEKNKGNTIFGGMLTSVNRFRADSRIESLVQREAYSGGLDFEQNFKKKTYYVSGKMMFSHLRGSSEAIRSLQESNVHLYQRPDAIHMESRYDTSLTSLSGSGGYLAGGKKGGKWRFHETVRWLSPGFDMNDMGYLRQADVIAQSTQIAYRENEPHKFSRNYNISLSQSTSYSYSGELVYSGGSFSADNTFKNLWGISFYWNASFPSYESRELRGGPALWMNSRHEFAFHGNSNYAKDLSFNGGVHYTLVSNESSENIIFHMELNWYPIRRIHISPFAMYTINRNDYQYIETLSDLPEPRYLMGKLDQETLEFTLRAEFFLNPEISLQFYGSPYYSVGHYSEFHYVNDSRSHNTAERFHTYSDDEITNQVRTNLYLIDESETGMQYTFTNPDFMFGQLRTNLVFRWEYKLGSVLYLVWSHDRTNWENQFMPELSENYCNLNAASGNNIFLLKLNYWFSL